MNYGKKKVEFIFVIKPRFKEQNFGQIFKCMPRHYVKKKKNPPKGLPIQKPKLDDRHTNLFYSMGCNLGF